MNQIFTFYSTEHTTQTNGEYYVTFFDGGRQRHERMERQQLNTQFSTTAREMNFFAYCAN